MGNVPFTVSFKRGNGTTGVQMQTPASQTLHLNILRQTALYA
jgi:hypothetical protein